jgi:hypothetical protein
MKDRFRSIVERKIGSKFITKSEKDKLREQVLNHKFFDKKQPSTSKG